MSRTPEAQRRLKTALETVPPRLAERKGRLRPAVLLAGLAFLGAVVLLFSFNPAQHAFYPRCLFAQVTGWQCPGCGGLRAAHQLLHGHLLTALQFNALAVLGAPLAVWLVWREVSGRSLKLRPAWLWVLGAALLAFGVLRNLPGFAWLAP